MARRKRSKKTNNRDRRNLEHLEERQLLDAGGLSSLSELPVVSDAADVGFAPIALSESPDGTNRKSADDSVVTYEATRTADLALSQLVIVDLGAKDNEAMLASLRAAQPNTEFDVRFLDSSRDGLEQIGEILASGGAKYDAIHILSHGAEGELHLGESAIDEGQLQKNQAAIAAWSSSLREGADILIYGCDLAGNEAGESFLKTLRDLTGADVAASNDLTGNAALGGDWDLEVSYGEVNEDLILQNTSFDGVLTTVTGITFIDYNNNGLQDAGQQAAEVGIDGVVVTGYDSNGNVVASTTSSGGGNYTLNNPAQRAVAS